MTIFGIHNVTLTDYPGKIATIVFTAGCPFRCGFCYNPKLVLPPFENAISEKTFFNYLVKRKNLLEGVVITGGEPTIHTDLMDFITRVHVLGFSIKLDTCGYVPENLKKCIDSGLVDYIAMDIKAPLDKYADIVQRPIDPKKIIQSIHYIINSGISYEFRSTLINELHSFTDVTSMARSIEGAMYYYLQPFHPSHTLVNRLFETYTSPPTNVLEELTRECERYVDSCLVRA
jgi:pyruvate formate lyase activating enzyme